MPSLFSVAVVSALLASPPDAPRFGEVQLSTGITMHYAEQGDARGQPIILLHGYSDSWFSFSRVLTPLSRRAHVYALDLRGHGKTDKPKAGYLMGDLAQDVIAFMDAKKIVRATVIGHSMGSLVAQQVAVAAPRRVSHLVLIGAPPTGKDLVGWNDLAQAVAALPDPVPEAFARDFQVSTVYTSVGDEFMNTAVSESLRLPARVWRELAAGMAATRLEPALGKSGIPILILRGEKDAYVSAAATDSFAAMLNAKAREEYPNTGHALHWEQPTRFSADVLAFLSNLPADPPRFGDVHLSTGIRMHYAEQGEARGEPIILLHGYSDSWFSYSKVIPLLSRDARVYALDQRGHGRTDKPLTGYQVRDLAADVVAFMIAKGIVRATIVGHSMGGLVAQQVALVAPKRVSRLVLVATAVEAKSFTGFNELDHVVATLLDPVPEAFVREFQVSTVHAPVGDEFMNMVVSESLRLPALVWRELAAGMAATGPAESLGKSGIPTLVLTGEKDAYISVAATDALVALVNAKQRKSYANTGHAVHWERPSEFAQDVLGFVAR